MSAITTHVLDVALGHPAAGVPVTLERIDHGGSGLSISSKATDRDGRVGDLAAERVDAGTYRLTFETASYFAATGQTGFYPLVSIVFTITDPRQHHHVPLLLSPFAYSTYRGS